LLGATGGGVHGSFFVGTHGAVVRGGGGGVYCAYTHDGANANVSTTSGSAIENRDRFVIVSTIACILIRCSLPIGRLAQQFSLT